MKHILTFWNCSKIQSHFSYVQYLAYSFLFCFMTYSALHIGYDRRENASKPKRVEMCRWLGRTYVKKWLDLRQQRLQFWFVCDTKWWTQSLCTEDVFSLYGECMTTFSDALTYIWIFKGLWLSNSIHANLKRTKVSDTQRPEHPVLFSKSSD